MKECLEITINLLQDSELSAAHDLIEQTVRLMQAGLDAVIRKAQLVGQSIHSDELAEDADFWSDCLNEWGNGSGYRNRVNMFNKEWFETQKNGEPDARVTQLVASSWLELIASVRHLLVRDDNHLIA